MPEWYSYSSITFDREQIFPFLLFNLETMKAGNWPPEPIVETGYTDAPIQTGRANHSPHEASCIVAAEIETRLRRTGRTGDLLIQELFSWKEDWEITVKDLSPLARKALNYISGRCRRWIACDKCNVKKCKRRGRLPCTFNEWINNNRRK